MDVIIVTHLQDRRVSCVEMEEIVGQNVNNDYYNNVF